jgi:hypothetical protein
MFLRIAFVVLGVMSLGNGLYMLAAPDHWFHEMPAAIPDTGPMNPHFVRDVGVVYALAGAGLLWAALNIARAYPVLVMAALFYAGHAALHVADILTGHLPADHWGIDFSGVFLPAIILCTIAWPPVWKKLNPPATNARRND